MSIIMDAPSTTAAARTLRADLVERAAKLRPLLADNADATDRDRAVPAENIDALAGAGLLSLTRPARHGGLQTDFRTLLEVSREIARACGSTSWVATLLNASAWFVGLFPALAQDDVWAGTPDARIAGVVTPSGTTRLVEGGYRVSGRWAPASGCAHADWAVLGVVRPDAEGTADAVGIVLAPMAELVVEDTWFVTGMRGTASNTLVGEDVFVPAHRFLSVPDAVEGRCRTPFTDEALYRAPFVPVAAITLTGPQLGLAAAAVDVLAEKAPRRALTMTHYATQAEAPTIQIAAANAASLADSAQLHAYRAAADIDEAALVGVFPDYDARARMRMDAGMAVVHAREAVRIVCSAQGASTFGEANPLQRVWRDIETGSRHAVLNPEVAAEIYGKSLFGIRGTVSALV
ncbi:acyl-CoA dehydrogenase family protein [Umezawaea tangerina]|uniref:Alkylation response protein AidB-like acyl-CoA dehydrogenase n=1 Tax=Umezawaea tangerina TaxID=84725 RepID=A0A2T0T472_9PSEU|nr:acyl-CoA dehydrogenase family protein [Umezawaea tangerina]PRY40462.1 alkylation response protein AidB-like acyl-CoA dehydrogenase [Umezawaea tangerina]